MAIIDARMQHKRGLTAKLDINKLLPGEIAIPTDGDIIYVCIRAGVVLEIPSLQNLKDFLDEMKKIIEQGNVILDEFNVLEVEKVGINDSETSTLTTYSSSKILQLIEAINELSIKIVSELPTEDIQTQTLYFVPKDTSDTGDVYDEYIYINEVWEHIGSTAVDLSDYYNKSEVDNKVDAINTSLANKQNLITGAASTITDSNLTASRVLATNAAGKISVSNIAVALLNYLSGLKGNVQTQLNTKLSTTYNQLVGTLKSTTWKSVCKGESFPMFLIEVVSDELWLVNSQIHYWQSIMAHGTVNPVKIVDPSDPENSYVQVCASDDYLFYITVGNVYARIYGISNTY